MLTKRRGGVSLPFDTITICPVEKGLSADVHIHSHIYTLSSASCNVTCSLHKSCMLPIAKSLVSQRKPLILNMA